MAPLCKGYSKVVTILDHILHFFFLSVGLPSRLWPVYQLLGFEITGMLIIYIIIIYYHLQYDDMTFYSNCLYVVFDIIAFLFPDALRFMSGVHFIP